tara:strand:+ start:4551 stop:4778 length:228 start_codon:yes stop_codon:yes gene_type:complete
MGIFPCAYAVIFHFCAFRMARSTDDCSATQGLFGLVEVELHLSARSSDLIFSVILDILKSFAYYCGAQPGHAEKF